MCRLLAMGGKLNKDFSKSALEKFRSLAESGNVPEGFESGHKDGWGIAVYGNNAKLLFIKKSAKNAGDDLAYQRTIKKIGELAPRAVLAHLRKASVGKKAAKNSHPFIFGNYAFCHNGKIEESERLPLTEFFKKKLTGQTDSEKFFFFILQNISGNLANADASTVRNAIKQVVGIIHKNFKYPSLNFLFSNGKFVWVLRKYNPDNKFVKEKNLKDYYTLYCGLNNKKDAFVISSEILDEKGVKWSKIKNNELLEFDLSETASVKIKKYLI